MVYADNMIKLAPLLFFYLLVHGTATGQDKILEDIGVSLKNGSARELIKFCADPMTIKLDDSGVSYSKNQAESRLRQFFQENPPTNFAYIHQGSSREGLRYCIGKYSMKQGSYRVVLLIKQQGANYLVDQITLTKE